MTPDREPIRPDRIIEIVPDAHQRISSIRELEEKIIEARRATGGIPRDLGREGAIGEGEVRARLVRSLTQELIRYTDMTYAEALGRAAQMANRLAWEREGR